MASSGIRIETVLLRSCRRCLRGRIMAIADVYDAPVSKRPYKGRFRTPAPCGSCGAECMRGARMNINLKRATELQNEAIRCNNRLRFAIAELSAHVQKNRDLAEELKDRSFAQRLSDLFSGRKRSIRNEINRNAARINACLLDALREIDERNRISREALSFVRRLSAEMCETAETRILSEYAVRPPRAPEP
jgi:HD-GYP domain-containing protein (c-di-GMP phosphodiesterase class II)